MLSFPTNLKYPEQASPQTEADGGCQGHGGGGAGESGQ